MIENILEFLSIQETWETIVLQFKILFDPETSFLAGAFKVFFEKVLNNPLASIITLLALIGLPYTLYKARQSSTEANERLDQLIDEMKDFEFEKPLIDLQEKFKEGTIENSPVINYDHDVLELNFEKTDPEYHHEVNNTLPDMEPTDDFESTTFVKQITLDQEVTDDFLASGPLKLESELNEEQLDLSPLAEEVFEENVVSPSGEFNIDEKEFADFYSEAPEINEPEQELTSVEEEAEKEEEKVLVSAEATPPPPEEPRMLEEVNANIETDDLKTRMEQAIQKLQGKYSSPAKEIDNGPAPSVFKKLKKTNWAEESKAGDHKSTPSSSPVPSPLESRNGEKKNSLKKSHVITHLNSFQKNLENHLDTKSQEIKEKSTDHQQKEVSSFETALKPTKITCLPQNKTTDEEYQQALESFLFLRDQKRNE